jgi:hypothetical protein
MIFYGMKSFLNKNSSQENAIINFPFQIHVYERKGLISKWDGPPLRNSIWKEGRKSGNGFINSHISWGKGIYHVAIFQGRGLLMYIIIIFLKGKLAREYSSI